MNTVQLSNSVKYRTPSWVTWQQLWQSLKSPLTVGKANYPAPVPLVDFNPPNPNRFDSVQITLCGPLRGWGCGVGWGVLWGGGCALSGLPIQSS